MLLKVSRENLLSSLAVVQSIVERRNAVPILEHVKVDLLLNEIKLTTTDMDINISSSFESEVPSDMIGISFTTVVQPLYDVIRKIFNCNEVYFDLENIKSGTIFVKANNSKFVLPCLEADSFPTFGEFLEPQHQFETTTGVINFLLSKSKHAMASGETRYYLNGIYLHNLKDPEGNNMLCAVATDIHRLAKVEIEAPRGAENIKGVIIPRKSVLEISKLLEEYQIDQPIQVEIGNHRMRLVLPNVVLVSKLVDAVFPNYEAALPIKCNAAATISTKEFSRAIDLVSTISEGKVKTVRLEFNTNILGIIAENQGQNRSSALQEIATDSGEIAVIDILMNSRYVMDTLSVIEGDSVEVRMIDNVSPVLVIDQKNKGCRYILMPMQLSST